MDDIVEIARYGTVFGAEIASAHLESLGIDHSIATDNAGGAFPSMTGLGGGARLMVRAEDAEAARAALEDLVVEDS